MQRKKIESGLLMPSATRYAMPKHAKGSMDSTTIATAPVYVCAASRPSVACRLRDAHRMRAHTSAAQITFSAMLHDEYASAMCAASPAKKSPFGRPEITAVVIPRPARRGRRVSTCGTRDEGVEG